MDTVFNFIKNNPGAYNVVELFVKKNSEFAWYKEFLANHAAESKRMMMHKKMMMLVAAFAVSMQAMEQENQWSITAYGTKINLIKGFIGDAENRVDVIVLGRNQQQVLIEPDERDSGCAGWEWFEGGIIRQKHRDDESASDEDTYNVFDSFKNNMWQRASIKKVRCDTVVFKEPCIIPHYIDKSENAISVPCCLGENRLLRISHDEFLNASKELKECYEDILADVLEGLDEDGVKEKKIAIPTLSTEVGFPRYKAAEIAVSAIFNFIKNNYGAYDIIELFVKKRSEVEWYKGFLERYIAKKKYAWKISLLFCMFFIKG